MEVNRSAPKSRSASSPHAKGGYPAHDLCTSSTASIFIPERVNAALVFCQKLNLRSWTHLLDRIHNEIVEIAPCCDRYMIRLERTDALLPIAVVYQSWQCEVAFLQRRTEQFAIAQQCPLRNTKWVQNRKPLKPKWVQNRNHLT